MKCDVCHKEIDIDSGDYDVCIECELLMCTECFSHSVDGKCIDCNEIIWIK